VSSGFSGWKTSPCVVGNNNYFCCAPNINLQATLSCPANPCGPPSSPPAAPAVFPACGGAGTSLSLAWTPAAGVNNYAVDIVDNAACGTAVCTGCGSPDVCNGSIGNLSSYTLPGTTSGKKYYWQVRAQSSAGLWSPWSSGLVDCGIIPPPPPGPPGPPPIGACKSGNICGTITAAENPTQPLQYIAVQLRDVNGKVIKTALTDGTGQFTFGSLTGGPFYVFPAVDRTEASIPNQIQSFPSGNKALFSVSNVPATLTFSQNAPGTVILVTTSTYVGNSPPPLGAGGSGLLSFSSIVDKNGQAVIKVPGRTGSSPYKFTCWEPAASANAGYVRKPAAPHSFSVPDANGGSGSIAPEDQIPPHGGSPLSCSTP